MEKDHTVGAVVAVVAVSVVALLGTDVVHLVDGAAFGAALNGAVARHGQPVDDVRVGGGAGATDVLLVTERADDNGVLHGSCGGGGLTGLGSGVMGRRTMSARVEGLHVEDVDALHLSEDFETLETGGLVNVGGNGTGLGTLAHEVGLGRDL